MPINNAGNRVSQDGAPLDTYTELVSWTPTVFGDAVAGVGTYTTQQGYYTQIGELLHFTAKVIWTAHTGTGDLRMTLPLPVRTLANYEPFGGFASDSLNLPFQNTYVVSFFVSGSSTCIPSVIRDNNSTLGITISATGDINYEGWYLL